MEQTGNTLWLISDNKPVVWNTFTGIIGPNKTWGRLSKAKKKLVVYKYLCKDYCDLCNPTDILYHLAFTFLQNRRQQLKLYFLRFNLCPVWLGLSHENHPVRVRRNLVIWLKIAVLVATDMAGSFPRYPVVSHLQMWGRFGSLVPCSSTSMPSISWYESQVIDM